MKKFPLSAVVRLSNFFLYNASQSRKLREFSSCDAGSGLIISPYKRSQYFEVIEAYRKITGSEMALTLRLVLKLFGKRQCLTITNISGKLCAFSLYYFNKNEVSEMTLHEGFIGVLPDNSGQGLATILRKYAIKNFSTLKFLHGISSRISTKNQASIRSGLKVGYKLNYTYIDDNLGEERGYYVVKF